MRRRLNAKDSPEEERQNSLRRGDPWMSEQPGGSAVAQASEEVMSESLDVADVGLEGGCGGIPDDATRESSTASPRLSPAPAFP